MSALRYNARYSVYLHIEIGSGPKLGLAEITVLDSLRVGRELIVGNNVGYSGSNRFSVNGKSFGIKYLYIARNELRFYFFNLFLFR